jgi:rhodanese-related sulfurtransferase
MDFTTIIIAVVLGLTLGLLLNRSKETKLDRIHVINKEDFYNNMRKGQLVDIRKEDEYKEDRIKGARHFTSAQITAKRPKLRKDQSVYLYCNNGKKSLRTAKKMTREGYHAIYILEGGFKENK